MSGEPEHPGFHRGRLEDQHLFDLLGHYDLEGGLSPDWRKRLEIDDYEIGWPEGLIRSVRLPNGYTLWMALDPYGIDVLTRYSRSTLGTLGALIGYQVGDGEADVDRIREALNFVIHWVESGERFDPPWQDVVLKVSFSFHERWATGKNAHYRPLVRLDYAEDKLLRLAFALTRYYRAGFDDLSDKEQCQFLMAACERINKVAKPLNQLARFLEFGTGAPGEKLRLAVEDAERDVRVVYLHDIRGLSFPNIALMLGVAPAESDRVKRDPQSVRKMAERGRKLLNEALDGGWEDFAARARQDFAARARRNFERSTGDSTNGEE